MGIQKIKINKVILSIVVLLVLFGSLLLFLNSSMLANNVVAIRMRAIYQNLFWSVETIVKPEKENKTEFDPIYTFQVQKWSDTFVYRISGTFEDINTTNNTIIIRGKDNKIYTFKVTKGFIERQSLYKFTEPYYTPTQDIIR